MSAHTPGPWEWQGNSLVSNAPGLNYGSRYVIEVHDGTIYSEYSADGASLDCTAENAYLIAAAPDLYECARILASLIDPKNGGRSTPTEEQCHFAIATLAKARGEQ